MLGLNHFKNSGVRFVFTDIDDTLTLDGKLQDSAYSSMWDLHRAGVHVVPVTGRPAGWCELIARLWPIAGVVGENGALYFRHENNKMIRHFATSEAERESNVRKLQKIKTEILQNVPGAEVASDQFCRLFDLAIDFCEDVKPLPETEVDKIVSIFKKHGAQAKVSSIHVNGWFGSYDKLTMCQDLARREFSLDLSQHQEQIAFVGDSPNDEPMFAFFKNSFAVANINKFSTRLKSKPKFVASKSGGDGFAEIVRSLLNV